MSRVFFYGDLHLGDKNITKHRSHADGSTIDPNDHDMLIVDSVLTTVGKRDKLVLVGDVCLSVPAYQEYLKYMMTYLNNVEIYLGNHDGEKGRLPLGAFTELGIAIKPPRSYRSYMISHIPIHPTQFRNTKGNIHAHTHGREGNDLGDDYYCVSVESELCKFKPISLEEINAIRETRLLSRDTP